MRSTTIARPSTPHAAIARSATDRTSPATSIRIVVPGLLLRSPRPGYVRDDKHSLVRKSIVDAWIAAAQAQGVRSIICLLTGEHLSLYRDLGVELPTYYRQHGFEVAHIEARDHLHPPLDAATLAGIGEAFTMLPKSVLVHCSAGVDRTGSAISYLAERFGLHAPDSGEKSR